jgi:hypothetical protein
MIKLNTGRSVSKERAGASLRRARLTTRAAQATTHSSRRSHGVASTLRDPWLRSATPAEILMCSVTRSYLLRSEPAAFCRTGEPPPSRPDSLSIVPEL